MACSSVGIGLLYCHKVAGSELWRTVIKYLGEKYNEGYGEKETDT